MTAPHYFLVHDTPAGVRYAYPRARIPLAAEQHRGWPLSEPALGVSEPAGTVLTVAKGWLVSDKPIVELRREKPGERVRDGWMKRDAPGGDLVSPDLQRAFDEAPQRPSVGEVEHFAEHEAAHACWVCAVFIASYRAHYVQGEPVVESERLDGWLPLPGDPDPDPDREWVVNDPSLLAVYGAHTAHLWPGALSGLRAPVIERLKTHPLVSTVIDSISKGTTLWVNIPWETPRTRVTHVKPYGKRKPVAKTVPVYAIEKRLEMQFPDGVAATSKAAAMAGFDAAIERQVERVLPFGENPAACDHCSGLGWVRRA